MTAPTTPEQQQIAELTQMVMHLTKQGMQVEAHLQRQFSQMQTALTQSQAAIEALMADNAQLRGETTPSNAPPDSQGVNVPVPTRRGKKK